MRDAQKAHRMPTGVSISINKLVEYCLANGSRRTAIIEDIIRPKDYLNDTRYNEIERAYAHYISSGCKDSTRLNDLDRLLQTREARTEHEESRILNALDAIELATALPLDLPAQVAISQVTSRLPKFEIAGVLVSVGPTNILQIAQRGNKTKAIGVIKPYFSKMAPLVTSKSGEKAALHGTLLHWYAEMFMSHIGEAKAQLCYSIDVFAGTVTRAPKSYISRRRQIVACAQEICDRWDPIRARLQGDDLPTVSSLRR
jgi:hypothetical protein